MRKLMCDIINSVQNFQAVEPCMDGEMAYNRITKGSFDAVTLNLEMPKLTGENLLQRLKSEKIKTPVIAIGSVVGADAAMQARAIELGAVDYLSRPFRLTPEQRSEFTDRLVHAIRFAVKDKSVSKPAYLSGDRVAKAPSPVVARRMTPPKTLADRTLSSHAGGSHTVKLCEPSNYKGKYSLVAIASSTGGPQALHTLLPMFPKNIGVPMVIVQHMPKGFTASLAERINAQSNLTVKEAEEGEVLKPNVVYIAPGGRHLQIVDNAQGKMCCRVYDDPPVNNLRPCADVMYESLKKVSADHIICAVLTGMGADGTKGITSLKKAKDLYVVTQSEETCVVYGMPKAADQAGLSNESLPITEISKSITKKLGV
ncbi:MAG: chemotaxis-specific protein-glutamate methyltransferase CheB [Lachnospiraceae bacterium]|nr:chemotaxis-specific protein-glutamate methyltransferase CheB [Lachnospiraceae bacterium]